MIWLLLVILMIVLIVNITKGNTKKSLEIEVLKNESGTEHSTTAKTSISDELIKLKQLLNDGVLTQDEFDEQKKKLLNN